MASSGADAGLQKGGAGGGGIGGGGTSPSGGGGMPTPGVAGGGPGIARPGDALSSSARGAGGGATDASTGAGNGGAIAAGDGWPEWGGPSGNLVAGAMPAMLDDISKTKLAWTSENKAIPPIATRVVTTSRSSTIPSSAASSSCERATGSSRPTTCAAEAGLKVPHAVHLILLAATFLVEGDSCALVELRLLPPPGR